MSVEDIEQVNKLAQNLLDQGLANSRDDAVLQAEKILNKKLAKPIDNQGSVIVKEDIERYKNIIERNKEYIEKHLKMFKEHIELLSKEIVNLKDEVAGLKAKGISKSTEGSRLSVKNVEEDSSEQASEEPKETHKKVVEKEKKESHPKRGDFNSDDVAIDKIFYYGNK